MKAVLPPALPDRPVATMKATNIAEVKRHRRLVVDHGDAWWMDKTNSKKGGWWKKMVSTFWKFLGIWDFLNIEDCAQWSRWSVSICMVYCQCFKLTNLDRHFESIPEIYPNGQACDEVPFAVRWEWPWFWLVLFCPWATKLRHFCASESDAT